jgi:hypothetical protein
LVVEQQLGEDLAGGEAGFPCNRGDFRLADLACPSSP